MTKFSLGILNERKGMESVNGTKIVFILKTQPFYDGEFLTYKSLYNFI